MHSDLGRGKTEGRKQMDRTDGEEVIVTAGASQRARAIPGRRPSWTAKKINPPRANGTRQGARPGCAWSRGPGDHRRGVAAARGEEAASSRRQVRETPEPSIRRGTSFFPVQQARIRGSRWSSGSIDEARNPGRGGSPKAPPGSVREAVAQVAGKVTSDGDAVWRGQG